MCCNLEWKTGNFFKGKLPLGKFFKEGGKKSKRGRKRGKKGKKKKRKGKEKREKGKKETEKGEKKRENLEGKGNILENWEEIGQKVLIKSIYSFFFSPLRPFSCSL